MYLAGLKVLGKVQASGFRGLGFRVDVLRHDFGTK